MYKLTQPIDGEMRVILRISDGACIPLDEDNRDYQEYLEWLSEGNTPEEAE